MRLVNGSVTNIERTLRYAILRTARARRTAEQAGLGPIVDIDRTEALRAIRVERRLGFWLASEEHAYFTLVARLAQQDVTLPPMGEERGPTSFPRRRGMRACKYCGAEFDPPTAGTPMCRSCFYAGRELEEMHAALIRRIRARTGNAEILHTGGGCFGLKVDVPGGVMLFATVAYEDAGHWLIEPGVPTPGKPWGIGVYASADAFHEGEQPVRTVAPATDEQLLREVEEAVRPGVVCGWLRESEESVAEFPEAAAFHMRHGHDLRACDDVVCPCGNRQSLDGYTARDDGARDYENAAPFVCVRCYRRYDERWRRLPVETVVVCLDERHPEACFVADGCVECAACDAAARVTITGVFTLDDELLPDFLGQFLEVNRGGFEAQDYIGIAQLPVGGEHAFGGGAAAEFVLRRVA